MNLGVRIFLVYFLFVGLTAYFVVSTVVEEIKPSVRQSTEETLVDTANLLAEILREDVRRGTVSESRYAAEFKAYGERHPDADIWGIPIDRVSHRIYVTDARGIVLLDSSGRDVGKDYSRWNDVNRTLRGQYGARTTREDPNDEFSTVMYVAAPIRDQGNIIGVVTVAKPNRTVQPFIERSERRLLRIGGAMVALGLALGLLFSFALSRSLRRLTRYAQSVSDGERTPPLVMPQGHDEVSRLARAVETMRARLEGRDYVERYVIALTHELKSPLASIRGAAELIDERMPIAERSRFLGNIVHESERLHQLVERLLRLTQVEQRRGLECQEIVDLSDIVAQWRERADTELLARGLTLDNAIADNQTVSGERFLLQQAVFNLLDNARDFADGNSVIRIEVRSDDGMLTLVVRNQGEAIPEFALPRIFERFYSLPRPGDGRKSTGLGLAFVAEVAELHGGSIRVKNVEGGVEAHLRLPS